MTIHFASRGTSRCLERGRVSWRTLLEDARGADGLNSQKVHGLVHRAGQALELCKLTASAEGSTRDSCNLGYLVPGGGGGAGGGGSASGGVIGVLGPGGNCPRMTPWMANTSYDGQWIDILLEQHCVSIYIALIFALLLYLHYFALTLYAGL